VIGHRNLDLKRIGISKHRLMAGSSRDCAVCGTRLIGPDGRRYPHNHLCPDHTDWQMIVVDNDDDERRAEAVARLTEKPRD
jgi:hypothetical protein